MIYYANELYHHGIKGQKWGVRRFQREDGSLTNAGRKRYNEEVEKAKVAVLKAKKDYGNASRKEHPNTKLSNKEIIRNYQS